MGPSNLKQKRTFVTRSALKDIFDKERALGGQHETTKKLRGVASTLPFRVNTRPQTTEDHLTVDTANILPSLTTEQAFEPGHESSPVRSTETVQHASTEDVATIDAESKKRNRGPTTGKGLRKYFDSFGKIKINMDPSIGRPVNAGQSAKLSSNIGIITRGVLPMPKTWKDVDEAIGLMPGFDHLQNHMDVNIDEPGVKRSLVESIKRNTRQSRYKLHQHFLQYATVEEAKNNKPDSCLDKHNWDELCDHFASDKYKIYGPRIVESSISSHSSSGSAFIQVEEIDVECAGEWDDQVSLIDHRSEANKNNRKKVRCKQSTGRKAFTVRSHEISKIPGEPCGRIDLYESTHCSRKGEWMSVEAKNNWVLMLKKREEYMELEIEKSGDEIVLEVLGHGTGYTKGLGYGPTPPSRQLQQSKAQVQELKTQVTELKEALSAQNADLSAQNATLSAKLFTQGEIINKLMAFCSNKGMKF
ncbi:hypothetical protein OROMI_009447 [Orobanche minor]